MKKKLVALWAVVLFLAAGSAPASDSGVPEKHRLLPRDDLHGCVCLPVEGELILTGEEMQSGVFYLRVGTENLDLSFADGGEALTFGGVTYQKVKDEKQRPLRLL